MPERRELVWRVTGTVADTKFAVGKRERPFWQVLVEVDDGFVCMYVRSETLRKIAESLEKGDRVEASGTVKPRRTTTESKGPVWLDPVEHLRKLT
jgi:hypothetical protein